MLNLPPDLPQLLATSCLRPTNQNEKLTADS